jgi:DMSO/TMAO reductase YedYZ heme-binding membrane subunit
MSFCVVVVPSLIGGNMLFLGTLVVTVFVVALIHKPLKRFSWLFYLLAIAVCAAELWLYGLPAAERSAIFGIPYLIMRRGYLALALFTLVMFVGVFKDSSPVRRALLPLRAELSIIAAILIMGHAVPYLAGYLQLFFGSAALRFNIALSLIVSLVLLLLLTMLTVTSFNVVRRQMRADVLKRVQRLAYVFFLLIYAHLIGFLLPSALQGASVALTSISIYSLVFLSYGVLRLRKCLLDQRATTGGAVPAAPTAPAAPAASAK